MDYLAQDLGSFLIRPVMQAGTENVDFCSFDWLWAEEIVYLKGDA
jgi:hypothetical protein